MKPVWAIVLLASVLALLAGLAVATLFSINAGRASWILAGILVIDSAVLLLIGICTLVRRNRTAREEDRAAHRSSTARSLSSSDLTSSH
jgi:hypothetical protein